MTRSKLIPLILAGGFVTTLIEVRYLHRDVYHDFWQGYIPVIYCALAALVCLAAIGDKDSMRTLATLVFALGVVAGLYGVFEHSGGKATPFTKLFASGPVIARAEDGDEEGKAGAEPEPPILAPLGIAGLAAIGFALTSKMLKD